MTIKNKIKEILQQWNDNAAYRQFNSDLLNMYEGEIEKYIDKAVKARLSAQSYEQAKTELSPLNILPKIVDKLSTAYSTPPLREVVDGTETDKQIVEWYTEILDIESIMVKADVFFNMFRCALIMPYFSKYGIPKCRVVPNDRFMVMSDDTEDSTNPTAIMLLVNSNGNDKHTFLVYTDEEIVYFDQDGNILAQEENPSDINPIGKLPFIYINRSANLLIPKKAEDLYRMSILIPVILSDLMTVIKFQSFSIMYGIDLEAKELVYSPNMMWQFKSDTSTDKTPQIGTIKPEANITEVYKFAMGQLSAWLTSRNIRVGTIGTADAGNISSGISKIIDDADTTEFKKAQKGYFKRAEKALWDLLLKHLHPYYLTLANMTYKAVASPSCYVDIEFVEDVPFQSRGLVVKDLEAEVKAGFMTVKDAIAKLNPYMTEEQIDAYMIEIEEEKKVEIVENKPIQPDLNMPELQAIGIKSNEEDVNE